MNLKKLQTKTANKNTKNNLVIYCTVVSTTKLHDGRFHQRMTEINRKFQRFSDEQMMIDYRWYLIREGQDR